VKATRSATLAVLLVAALTAAGCGTRPRHRRHIRRHPTARGAGRAARGRGPPPSPAKESRPTVRPLSGSETHAGGLSGDVPPPWGTRPPARPGRATEPEGRDLGGAGGSGAGGAGLGGAGRRGEREAAEGRGARGRGGRAQSAYGGGRRRRRVAARARRRATRRAGGRNASETGARPGHAGRRAAIRADGPVRRPATRERRRPAAAPIKIASVGTYSGIVGPERRSRRQGRGQAWVATGQRAGAAWPAIPST